MLLWNEDELLQAAAASLLQEAARLDSEQAIHGLDSWDELAFHPMLAAAFAARGLGVFREFPLPGPVGRRAKRTQRERCDLVLTPDPNRGPADPMATLVLRAAAESTLFARVSHDEDDSTTPLEACYFLEVKCVGQWVYIDGVPGPNRSYASALTGAIATDLKKLASDDGVVCGGVLLVLFTDDQRIAEHDVPIALHRTLDRGILFRSPRVVGVPIANRIGNGWCTLLLVGKPTP